ncbi:CDP-alcohol phosphatidyltransferase family protein [SAR202 cluster bacterium AD-812-D07_MRT_10900m]|nr:CDP-alcohol phosphatidyltransferase family protein [SAR202 cluster bacterium AD-812-D07_MRT_10900m]
MSLERPVVLDTTPKFDAGLVALYEIRGHPWLWFFLDMVADAGATGRLIVLARSENKQEIERIVSSHPRCEGASVVIDLPDLPEALQVRTDRVYTRHLFIRVVRSSHGDLSKATVSTLEGPEDMQIAEDITERETGGNRTVLVHYFYRPLATRLVALVAPTGITPNAITLMSLIIVPVTAVFIVLDNYWFGVSAAVLLQLFFTLDVMDGVLARKLKQPSKFGYWFDTMVDTMLDASMAVAFTIGAVLNTGSFWPAIPGAIWLIAMSAVWSNGLIETAAGINHTPRTAGITVAVRTSRFGIGGVLRLARKTTWALGKPEIVLAVFGIGLVLGVEWAVVVFFALFHGYNLLRMFQLAYLRYRRLELPSSPSR